MKFGSMARINTTIVVLCITAILLASAMGFVPDDRAIRAKSRSAYCEALAVGITNLVSRRDFAQADLQLKLYQKRNSELICVGLRASDGRLMAEAGNHKQGWQAGRTKLLDGCYVVPIQLDSMAWGALELQFTPLYAGASFLISPALLKLLAVLVPLIGLASWLHLRRILKYLDPSQAVPTRVRQALDSFAEGVVLLDNQDQIVLANDAFATHIQSENKHLVGTKLSSLPWSLCDDESKVLPWHKAEDSNHRITGATVSLECGFGQERKVFSVNSSVVEDEKGIRQGTMVVFADVTPLETKRAELADSLEKLHAFKDAISRQNEELRFLATRDPLTGCINRRTLFEQFSGFWQQSVEHGTPMCVMMVDIDFFKSVNDRFGHRIGDDVLRKTGGLLISLLREEDVVCRYGGEEFSVLMPGVDIQSAVDIAELIRLELSNLEFPGFSITASFGVSSIENGASDTQELLDQADKCLYVAKRNGRNQVVRFDTVAAELLNESTSVKLAEVQAAAPTIPYPAVAALLSALTYRDAQTGAHSARVANYAALLAQRLLRPREVYLVEMAGLLHDIGKIGVPDAILLKPGSLTKEEWQFMERHDRIGIEIINKAFKNTELTAIVKHHHTRFDEDVEGEQVPIGARILTIADSFDAMVSDRPYRKGMSIPAALAELQRCAGGQFDPNLVDLFIQIVHSGTFTLPENTSSFTNEVALSIGEQMERLVDAADQGDLKAYRALLERLQMTAEQSNLDSVAKVAARVSGLAATEDTSLQDLADETFELLSACRSLHQNVTVN